MNRAIVVLGVLISATALAVAVIRDWEAILPRLRRTRRSVSKFAMRARRAVRLSRDEPPPHRDRSPSGIESSLNERVLGQPGAVWAVAQTLYRVTAGFRAKNRPVGSLLFLGPPGVGKTTLVRQLADILVLDTNNLIEVQLGNAVTTTGDRFLGHIFERLEPARRPLDDAAPTWMFLIDDLHSEEKGIGVLQDVLETGQALDEHGKVIDFRQALVICTSGIARGGFDPVAKAGQEYVEVRKRAIAECGLAPRLIESFDMVAIFFPFNGPTLKLLVDKVLGDQIRVRPGFRHESSLQLAQSAYEFLVARCSEGDGGIRAVRRVVEEWIVLPLSRLIVDHSLEPGTTYLFEWNKSDELMNIQIITPMEVPGAPPEDLVPAALIPIEDLVPPDDLIP